MSEFNVEDFDNDPSVERRNNCRKDDLYALAEYYCLEVRKNLKT